MKYGFITVGSAIPSVRVADVDYNLQQHLSLIRQAESQGVEVLVFPELSLTGYTCQDLFRQQTLLDKAEEAVRQLIEASWEWHCTVIVGAPVPVGPLLLNAAVVIQRGELITVVPKTYLPNYAEFYEKRWFASAHDLQKQTTIHYAGEDIFIENPDNSRLVELSCGVRFGIELCEDLWAPAPPSNQLALAGADIIFNLSATDELIGKHDYLLSLLAQQSARLISGYVYSSCGFGESTQDVVYGGNALIYENGRRLAQSERFSTEPQLVVSQIDVERIRAERRANTTYTGAQTPLATRGTTVEIDLVSPDDWTDADWHLLQTVNPTPFIPTSQDMRRSCEEIFNIQTMGLAKRLAHIRCQHVVIGISGGLDSTLALLVCAKTFDRLGLDRTGIVGVTMPGFGTTDRTYQNALALMQSLGITIREISIVEAVNQHFEDIGHDASNHDITYENSQARERTQLLMDISNQVGGIVIGTGDLSELALGWCTYNGDHMSMYGVNVSIPKTLIKYLVRYVAETEVDEKSRLTLLDIIDTPISPELIPADEHGQILQKTEDLVGPYELHDFFLYYFLRFGFSPKKIFMLARHAFSAEQYTDETIKHWLTTFVRRFFSQQFKRSCLPDGPKVGSVSLSPRGDWRMPSDACAALWLEECKTL